MSGRGIRLYTDEDVDPALATQLNLKGYDVISCHVAGNQNQGLSDEWQLTFAVSDLRAILVYNIHDYMARDAEWRMQGREHFGIIYTPHLQIGELVRRTSLHLDTFDPIYHHNLVMYLAQ